MTNFEKICKGTPEGLVKIIGDGNCDICVYQNMGESLEDCGGNCASGILEWLNSPAPIELTQTEKEICVGLKHLGYRYLARDCDNVLTTHTHSPSKEGYGKWSSSRWFVIDPEGVFDFIKWEGDEPTRIDDLLGG